MVSEKNYENLLFIHVLTTPMYNEKSLEDNEYLKKRLFRIYSLDNSKSDFDKWIKYKLIEYPEFSEICGFVVGMIKKDETGNFVNKIYSEVALDEIDILKKLHGYLNKVSTANTYKLVGFNLENYQLLTMCKRFVVNNLPIPEILKSYTKKPWEVDSIDIGNLWKFGSFKNYADIQLIADTLGIENNLYDLYKGTNVYDFKNNYASYSLYGKEYLNNYGTTLIEIFRKINPLL